mgnify:CR=1 FL=1
MLLAQLLIAVGLSSAVPYGTDSSNDILLMSFELEPELADHRAPCLDVGPDLRI